MSGRLEELREHVDVLEAHCSPAEGKKPKGGKTERHKAVVAVLNALSDCGTVKHLSSVSAMEMVRGPQEDTEAAPVHLGWAELACVVIETLNLACNDALAAKSTSKSGVATVKPDFMRCFRRVLKLSLQHAPKGVLRPIVPALLYYGNEWLSEPALRGILAADIWQCVRELLKDDTNRAMLTPVYTRSWIDICFEQITGRGPLKVNSVEVTNLAGEVLQILSTPVKSFDTMSQSSRGTTPSRMQGGDLGYALVCERCAMMLVVANAMPKRQARDVQQIAFRTLQIALSDHATDVADSTALASVVNVSLKPLLSSWSDRNYHASAVSLARLFSMLSPSNQKLRDELRRRLIADAHDPSSAVLRAGEDVKDEYIDTAAICFSFREALEFATASNTQSGQVVIWLRVAHSIMSMRVLKKEAAVQVDPRDMMDQCSQAAETASQVIQSRSISRSNVFAEIVRWSTALVDSACIRAERLISTGEVKMLCRWRSHWNKLYLTVRDQVSKMPYGDRNRMNTVYRLERESQPNVNLLRSASLICYSSLIDDSVVEVAPVQNTTSSFEVPFPFSRLVQPGSKPSYYELKYAHNLISRTGIPLEDSANLRTRLVQSFMKTCAFEHIPPDLEARALLDASAATLALSRGECYRNPRRSSVSLDFPGTNASFTLYWVQVFFNLSAGNSKISGEGSNLVSMARVEDFSGSDSRWKLDVMTSFPSRLLFENRSISQSKEESSLRDDKHKTVDSAVSEGIEGELIEHLGGMLQSAASGTREQDTPTASERQSNETRKLDLTGVSLRVSTFLANYLQNGFSLGLFSTKRTDRETSTVLKLMQLTVTAFSTLKSNDFRALASSPAVLQQCLHSCCQLCNTLDVELERGRLHSVSCWRSEIKALSRALVSITTTICTFLTNHLIDLSKQTDDKIRGVSDHRFFDSQPKQASTIGRKRKPREPATSERKRLRLYSNDSFDGMLQLNHSMAGDSLRQINCEFNDAVSDSSDEPEPTAGNQLAHSRQGNGTDSRSNEVVYFCRIAAQSLEVLLKQREELTSKIFSLCESGLTSVDDTARRMDPDERSRFFSYLVAPTFVEVRQLLWDVLLGIGCSESVRAASIDILRLGDAWIALENTSQRYVSFYVESLALGKKRKQFPAPCPLEAERVRFLQYAHMCLTRMTELCRPKSQLAPVDREVHRAHFLKFIEISEHFRKRHAFRMPRLTRMAYLNFCYASIRVFRECFESASCHVSSEESKVTTASEAVRPIQTAIFKFFTDIEGAVRYLAATLVPKLLGLKYSSLVCAEDVLKESLPDIEMCSDSDMSDGLQKTVASRTENEEDTLHIHCGGTEDERNEFFRIHSAFSKVGSFSKGLAAIVALAEVSVHRQDMVPFLFRELSRMLQGNRRLLVPAHIALIRMCASMQYRSPRALFRAFSRTVYSKMLLDEANIRDLFQFPAPLVLDQDHHSEGVQYDWLREEQTFLLPYVLVQDEPSSLKATKWYAESIGLDLKSILERNVGAFTLVFPMQFTEDTHENGRRLWEAINHTLGGKSMELLLRQKEEVLSTLLNSVSCGPQCLRSALNRRFGSSDSLGFSRDCRTLKPPCYDSLIVGLAINHLFSSSAPVLALPRKVLRGPLFADVRNERTGDIIADRFDGFVKECRRQNSTLVRCLLTASRGLDWRETMQPFHNRIDAYFCVGTLWRVLGSEVLVKSKNERLFFYGLVSRGFETQETCCDAAWLLLDVQQKLLLTSEVFPEFCIMEGDIECHADDREFLSVLETTRERQMYELLTTVAPVLTSIMLHSSSDQSESWLGEVARGALNNFLTVCASERLWATVASNGPFPVRKLFKEARNVYNQALSLSRRVRGGSSSRDPGEQTEDVLRRFCAVYRVGLNAQSSTPALACLFELEENLSETTVTRLSERVTDEAWMRSSGLREPTAYLIRSTLACIVDLLCSLSRESETETAMIMSYRTSPYNSQEALTSELRDEFKNVLSNVLCNLGMVHSRSMPFVQELSQTKSIPSLKLTGKYEESESGIMRNIPLLLNDMRSKSTFTAENIVKSLSTLLKTDEGKSMLKDNLTLFESIRCFKGPERKASHPIELQAKYPTIPDPVLYNEITFDLFPNLDDPSLWSFRNVEFTHDAKPEKWMRRLCSALASNCKSPALTSLVWACSASFSFSCEMLPYLLMDIVGHESAEVLSALSTRIRENWFSNEHMPIRLLRVLVRAFDVLSQIGLRSIYTSGIGAWVVTTAHGNTQPCFYLIDVPYSDIIQAALRCGEAFSAIRFSHLYVDQKVMQFELRNSGQEVSGGFRVRRHSSCPARDQAVEEIEQAAKERVRTWVRDAMAQVNETDGARAFGHSENLGRSAVTVAHLDENWFSSLSALGVVARCGHSESLSMVSRSSDSGPDSRGVHLETELETFRSLIGTGNLNAACLYWDGLVSRVEKAGLNDGDEHTPVALTIEKMNDLRCAAAWKLQHWESPRLIPRPSDNAGGLTYEHAFHSSLYQALRLYRSGRNAETRRVLGRGRDRILRSLYRETAGVSVERVFEAASQLRVLAILQRARSDAGNAIELPEDAARMSEVELHDISQAYHSSKDYDAMFKLQGSSINSPLVPHHADSEQCIDYMLGKYFGSDHLDGGLSPTRAAFNQKILCEDLPVVLLKCIGEETQLIKAAATVSARILDTRQQGSWATAASCLLSTRELLKGESPDCDKIAWKLQECRLRWYASHDARSRKQALAKVKNIIFSDLRGKVIEKHSNGKDEGNSCRETLTWDSDPRDVDDMALLRSEACQMAANWSLDMRTHEPIDLFETYLVPGCNVAQRSSHRDVIGRAHLALASFADEQISNIDTYRRSPKYEQMVSSVQETEDHVERLRVMKDERIAKVQPSRRRSRSTSEATSGTVTDKVSKDLEFFISIQNKKVRQDRVRLEKMNMAYKKWQVLACKHFSESLRHGTHEDVRSAFRMVALWLDSGAMREEITSALTTNEDGSKRIDVFSAPVAKLLPLAPQLFSRLNYNQRAEPFQQTLAKAITEMVGLFPAQCLWQLLALSNATRVAANGERMASLYKGDSGKKEAADRILQRLQARHGNAVSQMRKVAEAYIALSETSARAKERPIIDMRKSELVLLGEQIHVPVPTVSLPIIATVERLDLPHIRGFAKSASVCDGLSKPLKITCLGSDGKEYPQIVKGRDDLRGDAVMQQMFNIMNDLLEKKDQAWRRNLYVRTYRILPLSPFSGIMQFVKNTRQFKELLVESTKNKTLSKSVKSLHERYRPNDRKHASIASQAYAEHKSAKGLFSKRVKFLTKAWKEFQPVFRHFFTEQWPDPAEWFTHQLSYSRSTAVISIVGFILGLGDRHLSNILVDVNNAEVVHIDFGVAFEQGKLLPTPEHMPFRLTRDLVDGFGIAGVEGVFRKSCEIALGVMRKHKQVLLTVVEVLLHDPMFNWALSPEDVLQEQGDGVSKKTSSGNDKSLFESNIASSSGDSIEVDGIAGKMKKTNSGSREAQRALNRVSEKLDGLEGTERLSVEAHVARLVDEAQAFHVIAPVYPGWAPWL